MGPRILLVLVCVLAMQPDAVRAQGRLQQVRDQVQTEAERPPSRECDEAEEGNCGFWDSFPGLLLAELFAGCGQDGSDRLYFRDFPYEGKYPGYLIEDPFAYPDLKETWCQDRLPRNYALRFSLENGNDFDGLNRLGGSFLAETSSRIGLLAHCNYFTERIGTGRRDDMTIGDVNLTYALFQSRSFILRSGLGARALLDGGGDHWGFNVHLGSDLFPCKPWIMSTSIDAGTLGSAGVFHSRGTVGVNWSRWELFGGYDFLQIGAVHLHGPLLGIRLWF